jgi:hypothetical protein
MRNIVHNTAPESLHRSLFEPWTYRDPLRNLTLRWDPADDSRYALQWRDPSGDPLRAKRGGMLGANRLAIEALPLLPCAPVGNHLHTTAFRGCGARDLSWSWPIWSCPITLDVCRGLVGSTILYDEHPNREARLLSLGIVVAFRSRRITVGKFRSFTPGTAIF